MATVRTPHRANQSARRWRSPVQVPKLRTGSRSRSGGTASTCILAPISMAAASGWVRDISGLGRDRLSLGMAPSPAWWRGWAARRDHFPDRDRRAGVTTRKRAGTHGPRFLPGSSPPELHRPLPSGAEINMLFYGHRRDGGTSAHDRFFKGLGALRIVGRVARPGRELAIVHGPQLATERLLRDGQAELVKDPLD